MAKSISGNHDGKNGENETYRIPGRSSNIPRKTLVAEVKLGKHPNHTVATINDKEYVKAKPNGESNDNVNRK